MHVVNKRVEPYAYKRLKFSTLNQCGTYDINDTNIRKYLPIAINIMDMAKFKNSKS